MKKKAKNSKKEYKIQTKLGVHKSVIWWNKEDKVYLVDVPGLPGVVTFGKSLTEAKHMAKDAIELYGDCVIDDGKVIIDDNGRVFGKLPRSRVLVPAQ